MKKKSMVLKFIIASAMIGIFSPSVNIETSNDTAPVKGYYSSPIQLDISLLNEAEARPVHRQTRRVARRTSRRTARRTSRRVNYRHNAGRYYGGGHVVHHHHHGHYGYWGGRPIVGFATGLAIGSVVAAATMPRSCVTTHVGGVSYRRCGNTYYQPFYQGDTVVYKVVPSPY